MKLCDFLSLLSAHRLIFFLFFQRAYSIKTRIPDKQGSSSPNDVNHNQEPKDVSRHRIEEALRANDTHFQVLQEIPIED